MTDQLHIMLDMETLSTGPSPVVLSIGALSFDPHGGDPIDEFHVRICARSAAQAGLKVTGDSLTWWLNQPNDSFLNEVVPSFTGEGTVSIGAALHMFDEWVKTLQSRKKWKQSTKVYLWGNGAGQDNVWLKEAFAACNMICSWHRFYFDRDLRTIIDLAETRARARNERLEPIDFKGEQHNALSDARHQVKTCQRAYKVLMA